MQRSRKNRRRKSSRRRRSRTTVTRRRRGRRKDLIGQGDVIPKVVQHRRRITIVGFGQPVLATVRFTVEFRFVAAFEAGVED
jgi:hypothetical protein